MPAKTIFSKIIDREIPARIAYEDERCLAFHDINPQAPTHVLIIPKRVIPSVAAITPEDRDLVGHLLFVAGELGRQLNLDGGYRVAINCGRDAGQTVDHLHLHLLGGRPLAWPPG